MSKIICDVCGTTYPETATQCPICGCVRSGDAVTIAGDTFEADVQQPTTYTHVKGGRFSKANVRKRNAGKPICNVESTPKPQRSATPKTNEKKLKKQETGLIIIVVVLLLAIAAVVVYITCTALGLFVKETPENTVNTTESIETTQTQPEETTAPTVSCESLEVDESSLDVVFTAPGQSKQLVISVSPENTTDLVTYYSEDEEIAKVDDKGLVTALSSGDTVVRIVCGEHEVECYIHCEFENPTEPEDMPEETEPTVTAPTTGPNTSYTDADFTLYSKDGTFRISAYRTLNMYTGKVPVNLIEWKSNDERVATVKDGIVTFVGVGRAVISATYNGKTLECIVRVY